ncbi:hypothetical protein NL676_019985 [Syzygium grande]|nr:hypothetical protein NL676_019985 [Syzygium grande]
MIKGKEAIVAKLTSLQQFRYQISHIDCAAFAPTRGATAQVTGDIWVDGKPDVLFLGQSFLLHPTPQGSFWIALQTWMTVDRSRMVQMVLP